MDNQLLVVALLIAVETLIASSVSAANLIVNPSFEQDDLGSRPSGWTYEGCPKPEAKGWRPVVAEGGYEGDRSALLECPANCQWVFLNQMARVVYAAGERYRLSVWLRADRPADVDLCIQPRVWPDATGNRSTGRSCGNS